ncbi:MAG: hypothetical protein K6E10_06670 [Eubacterium sp.]|nr:hypothetical protein [Eubacterium sp.]
MKNIRFYEAKKYSTSDYEKIEDMIYKTKEEKSDNVMSLALKQCSDGDLADRLIKEGDWQQGQGKLLEDYLILIYEGKTYYRDVDNIDTEDDIVFEEQYPDTGEANMIYVTSIVFEPEPELGENEPSDPFISQYPLEDILEEFYIYCYDNYDKENESDKKNSYIEFASDDIEDIRKVLSIIGKHVYNKTEGKYDILKIE